MLASQGENKEKKESKEQKVQIRKATAVMRRQRVKEKIKV